MQLVVGIILFIGIAQGFESWINGINPFFRDVYDTVILDEHEDARLKVPELVKKYGYPLETYNITTTDKYVLQMHRIPYGKDGPSENRPVVFLQHGLLSSSADWITPGPDHGLAYLLADRGYDVWMGNARGNRYSRHHLTLDPKEDNVKFWDFSWHEIGTIDVPAFIDLALNKTQQQQLFHIGHSQGTTTFYVMCSERPEYNKKIRAHISMSPVVYMNNLFSPFLRLLAATDLVFNPILDVIGNYEFLPTDGLLHDMSKLVCRETPFQVLCANALFLVAGFDESQLNTTLLPIMMGHTPAGASTKQFLHYAQGINLGKFRQYNYHLGNFAKYGRLTPPSYNLAKVTAPVYLMYSLNDWLSSEIDVLKLYRELPNAEKILVTHKKWNHLDYVMGIDAPTLVFNKIFNYMAEH